MGDSMKESALYLAQFGFPVFPCKPASKTPATTHGHKDASTETEQIEAWWGVNPDYNVALAVPEDMIVLDFEGASKESIEELIGVKFPPTREVLTPGKGGGLHLWYRKSPDTVVRNRVRVLKGLDVRAAGGYAMVPPSVHPDGGTYSWGNSAKVETAPDWLISMCQRSQEGEEKEEVLSINEMLAGIPRGMQRWAMFRYACSRRSKRYDPEEIKLILWDVAQNLDQDRNRPWTREDIDKIVNDVWRRYDALPEREENAPGKMWTPGELATHPFATTKWIIKPLLRRGVTIITSHAKRGKSMMVSTMLKSIALGEKVWGRFDSEKTGILYLDLEQDEDAAGERWEKIREGHNLENLRVYFSWPRMHKGGFEAIREFLLKNADVGLVVVDTWAMFNPAGPSADSERLNAYYQEYDVLGQLKRLANEFSIAVVIVHHFSINKERPSGTAAMEGSPDGDWRLHREEGSKLATLSVKGKNIPETKISFEVDLRAMKWNVTSVE